jgi:hypothetical protein
VATLWIRDVKATFTGAGGTLEVAKLRLRFQVSKSLSGSPNTANIEIWNLSEANRYKIKNEFDRARLEAGHVYAGNRGIIFDGFVRDVTHTRDGPDIITKVECGDGDKGFRQGVIAKTFPKKTKVKDMVEELRKTMPEVDKGVQLGLDELPEYPRPVTMYGPSVDELNWLGRTHKFYWSVQEGAMEIVPGDRAINEVIVISQESGMINVPQITDNGVKVEVLLNPDLRIGRVIEVRSEVLQMNNAPSRYRISSLGFSGDTRSNDYKAAIHGEIIKGGKVQEE